MVIVVCATDGRRPHDEVVIRIIEQSLVTANDVAQYLSKCRDFLVFNPTKMRIMPQRKYPRVVTRQRRVWQKRRKMLVLIDDPTIRLDFTPHHVANQTTTTRFAILPRRRYTRIDLTRYNRRGNDLRMRMDERRSRFVAVILKYDDVLDAFVEF